MDLISNSELSCVIFSNLLCEMTKIICLTIYLTVPFVNYLIASKYFLFMEVSLLVNEELWIPLFP